MPKSERKARSGSAMKIGVVVVAPLAVPVVAVSATSVGASTNVVVIGIAARNGARKPP